MTDVEFENSGDKIVDYHFNEFLCDLASFYYRLVAKSNIQVLLKGLVHLTFYQ